MNGREHRRRKNTFCPNRADGCCAPGRDSGIIVAQPPWTAAARRRLRTCATTRIKPGSLVSNQRRVRSFVRRPKASSSRAGQKGGVKPPQSKVLRTGHFAGGMVTRRSNGRGEAGPVRRKSQSTSPSPAACARRQGCTFDTDGMPPRRDCGSFRRLRQAPNRPGRS